MNIKNTFSKGTVNKDFDSRFIDSEELIDAENFFVTTVDGSSIGVGKNALGNALKTAYAITGGKTVGVGKNISNGKIYNCIKARFHDYIIEYDSATYVSEIVAQSTTGTRLNFRAGERVRNIDVLIGNTEAETLLKLSGDSNPPRIINIARAKTWGVDGFTAEELMLIKAPPLYPPVVEQVNTLDEKENFLKDKFISFATRYKYKDNYYSAISAWQEYSFTPDKFDLDYSSCENKGMVNIFNACDITFETGPREVEAIDLLFRYSNSITVYKVDQFVKQEQSWGNNIVIPAPIRFTNNKVFQVLPEDQYFRSYDNVPENNVAGCFAGNRAFLANYKDQKDLIDKDDNPVIMDYTVGYSSVDPQSIDLAVTKLPTFSLFDFSFVSDGRIRLDFSGVALNKDSAISILFDIKSILVVPGLTPPRTVFPYEKSFITILPKNYANIGAVIVDPENDFKSGLEGYFSDLFKSNLSSPDNSLPFPPSLFNGFSVNYTTGDVIEIILPSMKYEIEVLPSGPNTFVKEYMQDNSTSVFIDSIGSKKSIKSYRSYEVVPIYRDAFGRKSTGLSSEKNTIFIPLSKSASKNVLTVDMSTTNAPLWATTYKFAIKETIKTYEEIYITDFYVDGQFRWVKLDGTTKNKVKEGDNLLIKRDYSSVLTRPTTVKVLEIKTQESDFITDGTIIESPGLYMKIKPEGFNMPYNPDGYKEYLGFNGMRSGYPYVTIEIPNSVTTNNIPENSILTISLASNFSNEDEFNNYVSPPIIASSDYANFQAFYNAQIASIVFQGDNTSVDFGGVFGKESNSPTSITIRGTSNGRNTVVNPKSGFLNVKITLRTAAGFLIFEKQGLDVEESLFYETPDVFTIVNGDHVNNGENVVNGVHFLEKTFNCFSHGNGAESYQIRDAFNEKYISLDYLPTPVSDDVFKQINRYADITYSGIYNASTNINKLNEFNLYTANYKDDIDKSYGPIYKIKGEETNLQVFQESKDSQVFFGKDFLFNADGTSNLTKINDVLGSQDLYVGDFGISIHSDSYDSYGNNAFHTDVNRGVVMKKTNNGLFEISSQGLNSYFKTLFRDNTINHINGKYDQYNDVYILNIQYNTNQYVTWVYSDKYNGWLGRATFNPEDMCCINGKFLSFKNGEIYEHNQPTGRNTFYGIESPSKFSFNFSQLPSERKTYKTVELEATDSWQLGLSTDQDQGYINDTDFEKQEGVFRAYTRVSNDVIDTSLLSCQGIGNCTVNGLVLNFGFSLESIISINDEIRNSNLQLVGVVVGKTSNSLTLNAMQNITSGDFVLCVKPQSIENQGLLGYHMVVTATLSKNTKTEVYAIGSEIVKSYT